MVDLNKYRHIIWDWNGTLLDDAWLCVDVMNGMLSERGLPLKTLEEYRNLFDFPVRDYYEKLGYNFDIESFDTVGMEFIVRYNARHFETSLHPEAKGVLDRIQKLGFSQYILSAREQVELLAETRKLGVDQYFTLIRGLDDHYAHGKTGIGIELMKQIGGNKEEFLFIGDTRHDAEVAAEMGIDCLLIPHGHHSRERLEGMNVKMIGKLDELASS
jgi:phosphoglycolate phosphatase